MILGRLQPLAYAGKRSSITSLTRLGGRHTLDGRQSHHHQTGQTQRYGLREQHWCYPNIVDLARQHQTRYLHNKAHRGSGSHALLDVLTSNAVEQSLLAGHGIRLHHSHAKAPRDDAGDTQ